MLRVETKVFKLGQRTLAGPMAISIPAGQIHLLEGPNGCGKSLLLDVLTGIHRNRSVRASLNKIAISGGTYERWRAGMRRLFQTPVIPAQLGVEPILARFGAKGSDSVAWWEEAMSILKQCGVRLGELFGAHSFGQQRLVELVVALASGTYCLLDEPLAGLNLAHAAVATNLIRHAARRGRPILVIDHLSSRHPDLYEKVYTWNLPQTENRTEQDESLELNQGDLSTIEGTRGKAQWLIESFSIDGTMILREVEIELMPGTLLVLTGGNGSGKSTLLRALGDYGQPWPGVRGAVTGTAESGEIFLSPQPPKLVNELTAKKNLELMLGGGNPVPPAKFRLAQDLLDWLGFPSAHLSSRAEVLSGGEAGMVALVGASLSGCSILLLDEPFESLSLQVARKAVRLLKAVTASGKRVIASTHDPGLLEIVHPSQVMNLSKQATLTGHWAGIPLL
ncbi:MAG TPA: ATP-binding cassette domain-containing protein [Blastocatellia bacterium]|nr:ATP-binding cassette domain-containing protein [Blastocatellia bacterium]